MTKIARFVKIHGEACGGNSTAMLMSAIKNGLPHIWEKLDPDKTYTFSECAEIIEDWIEEMESIDRDLARYAI